jgi:hypothetical protein
LTGSAVFQPGLHLHFRRVEDFHGRQIVSFRLISFDGTKVREDFRQGNSDNRYFSQDMDLIPPNRHSWDKVFILNI